MKEKMCCIVGGSIIEKGREAQLKHELRAAIKKQAEEGAVYFQCGVERGFDHLAAQAVLDETKRNSNIRLFVVRPAPHDTESWVNQDKELLNKILRAACGQLYVKRDQNAETEVAVRKEMMNNSDYCIAYQCATNREIANCVDFMQKSGASTICIG